MARVRTAVMGTARWIGCIALGLFALATLATLYPGAGGVASVGRIVAFYFAPWIILLSVAGVAVAVRRWRRGRRPVALAMAGLAAFTALGLLHVEASVVRTAHANGLGIDLARTLWPGPTAHRGAPAARFGYLRDGGRVLPIAVYRPAPAAGAAGAAAPILVYVHGGGWISGTLDQRNADLRWFADRGYLVVSVEYTLSSDTRHLWNVTQAQVGCALGWIAAHAARFGGDPARIATIGDSAGGNLVLNASYMAATGTLPSACPGAVPRVSATVALYPVVDPARFHANDDALLGGVARRMAGQYAGGPPATFPARYAAIATATHLGRASPPTLLIVGEADKLVQPGPSYALADRARALGVDMRLIRVPFADHAFDYMSGSAANQLVRQASLRFLRDHGIAPAGPAGTQPPGGKIPDSVRESDR